MHLSYRGFTEKSLELFEGLGGHPLEKLYILMREHQGTTFLIHIDNPTDLDHGSH
jgi:hypothetical protein